MLGVRDWLTYKTAVITEVLDVSVGYYQCLRRLTESRLPSCIEQSDTAAPPSALADTVLMLMTRPLILDADNGSSFSYVYIFSISLS